VIFMGYYSPLLSYGEERILRDAIEAVVNGFIVVDLPPEEAVRFRDFCTKGGWVNYSLRHGLQVLTKSGSQALLRSLNSTGYL